MSVVVLDFSSPPKIESFVGLDWLRVAPGREFVDRFGIQPEPRGILEHPGGA